MHEGHRKRLKTRYLREGLDGFAAHEVLELLLTYAIPRKDVNPLAHSLIDHFGSLSAVLEATPQELQRFPEIGENAAVLLSMMPGLSGYYQRDRFGEKPTLTTAKQAGEYCKTLFCGVDHELVYLLCLDARGKLIHPALLQQGTIDQSPVYPRTVMETVIRYNAFAVVLAHNHPGGGLTPSLADYQVTRMVIDTLATISVRTIDHIIVAEGDFLSMARHSQMVQGLLPDNPDFSDRVKSIAGGVIEIAARQPALALEGYDGFEKEE